MRETFFLATSKEMFGDPSPKLSEYLANPDYQVVQIVKSGRRCLQLTLDASDGAQINKDSLIGRLSPTYAKAAERFPNKSSDVLEMDNKDMGLGQLTDITAEEILRMKEAKEILARLAFPFNKVPFYRGVLSGERLGDQYKITLTSDNHVTDNSDRNSVQFAWSMGGGGDVFRVSADYFKNGVKDFDAYSSTLAQEEYALSQLHIVEILRFVEGAQDKHKSVEIPGNAFMEAQDGNKAKTNKFSKIPEDTILAIIPHHSVVAELTYSSLKKAEEQLAAWDLPYQKTTFSRGAAVVYSLNPEPTEEGEVLLRMPCLRGNEIETKNIIEAREIAWRDKPKEMVCRFEVKFGREIRGDEIMIGGHKVAPKAPDWKKDVHLPTQAIIHAGIPSCYPIADTLEIDGYRFPLSPEQIAKLNNAQTVEPDVEYGYGDKKQRTIQYEFEFPTDKPDVPVLKAVKVALTYFNLK